MGRTYIKRLMAFLGSVILSISSLNYASAGNEYTEVRMTGGVESFTFEYSTISTTNSLSLMSVFSRQNNQEIENSAELPDKFYFHRSLLTVSEKNPIY